VQRSTAVQRNAHDLLRNLAANVQSLREERKQDRALLLELTGLLRDFMSSSGTPHITGSIVNVPTHSRNIASEWGILTNLPISNAVFEWSRSSLV